MSEGTFSDVVAYLFTTCNFQENYRFFQELVICHQDYSAAVPELVFTELKIIFVLKTAYGILI